MKQPINRSQFLKSILLGVSAFILDACRKPDPPAPTATNTPIPTGTPLPTANATQSPSPTPTLPEYCQMSKNAESYLFGFGSTRVKELEPGVYQLVIDRNRDPNASIAHVEFSLLAEIETEFELFVLWADENSAILKRFNTFYNAFDTQLIAEVTGLRDGDSGFLIPVMLLPSEQALACTIHPDFLRVILEFEGDTYLSISDGIWFQPVLVKSRQSGGSEKSGGDGGPENDPIVGTTS